MVACNRATAGHSGQCATTSARLELNHAVTFLLCLLLPGDKLCWEQPRLGDTLSDGFKDRYGAPRDSFRLSGPWSRTVAAGGSQMAWKKSEVRIP